MRLTQDQLIRQVIQGGGNMPAYGKNLSPAETTALVAFLETLHPAGQAPARDASRDVVLGLSPATSPTPHPGTSNREGPCRLSCKCRRNRGSFRFLLTLIAVFTAIVYLRGWLYLRSTSLNVIPVWRAASFLLGLFLTWAAAASPIASFDEEMLTAHMAQHLLLMTFAPPLIWLGLPVMPAFYGLPRRFAQAAMDAMRHWTPARQLSGLLGHPAFCWLAAAAALVAWHVPALFRLGMESQAWHLIEHASFLATGLLFWWPVVQPWPSVARWPRWSMRPISFPRHLAVRRPFRIAGVLRPGRLPDVPLHAPAVRPFRYRGSTVRGGVDVDLRYGCFSGRRDDPFLAVALAENFPRRRRCGANRPSGS